MNNKLAEILKKAKEIDNRAKQYDSSTDKSSIRSKAESMFLGNDNIVESEQKISKPITVNKNVDVNSSEYKKRVIESKLPPAIQKAMLENPIPQADPIGSFSLDEELIKEINPNYNKKSAYTERDEYDFISERKQVVKESTTPTENVFQESVIRKMIAEEIAKALPSIVENYFDKKMIQENVKLLKSIITKKKVTNNNI
jgi:hypothetical protein